MVCESSSRLFCSEEIDKFLSEAQDSHRPGPRRPVLSHLISPQKGLEDRAKNQLVCKGLSFPNKDSQGKAVDDSL